MNHRTQFRLRDARDTDYAFAKALYLETMETLLSELGAWDRIEFTGRIRRSFKPDEIQIIVYENNDIGFIHLIETSSDINIAQLHLADGYRGLGIGTKIIVKLVDRAEFEGKTLSLSAPRNNAAIRLYKRLGFKVSRDGGASIIDMSRDLGSSTE